MAKRFALRNYRPSKSEAYRTYSIILVQRDVFALLRCEMCKIYCVPPGINTLIHGQPFIIQDFFGWSAFIFCIADTARSIRKWTFSKICGYRMTNILCLEKMRHTHFAVNGALWCFFKCKFSNELIFHHLYHSCHVLFSVWCDLWQRSAKLGETMILWFTFRTSCSRRPWRTALPEVLQAIPHLNRVSNPRRLTKTTRRSHYPQKSNPLLLTCRRAESWRNCAGPYHAHRHLHLRPLFSQKIGRLVLRCINTDLNNY